MKVQWFRSATVSIETRQGTRVLCDPWMTDGAFIGSWFHWPPLVGQEFDFLAAVNWDAIYISHLHPDHFDRKLVSAIARRSPHSHVIVPAFAHPWLIRSVEACGFSRDRITRAENGRAFTLKDLTITVFTADYCQPSLCGVSVPCHQGNPRTTVIDSIAAFQADGRTVINANDALAVQGISRVLPLLPEADLLLGHFGGAGPFPQCFSEMTPDEMKIQSRALAMRFLERLAASAESLNARMVMPYAGQYMLGGRLVSLNQYRSVLSLAEAAEVLKSQTNAGVVTLDPFGSVDVARGEVSGHWVEPSQTELDAYLKRIEPLKFPYERARDLCDDVDEYLDSALARVKRIFENEFPKADTFDYAFQLRSPGHEPRNIHLTSKGARITRGAALDCPNTTSIEADPRLWKRLVRRRPNYSGFTQYHFNQAEIGSHLTWARRGEYSAEATHFLNFLQSEV